MPDFKPVHHTSQAWHEALPVPEGAIYSVYIKDLYFDPNDQLVLSIRPHEHYFMLGKKVEIEPRLPEMPGLHLQFPRDSRLFSELKALNPLSWENHEAERLVAIEHARRVNESLENLSKIFMILSDPDPGPREELRARIKELEVCCGNLLNADPLPTDWRNDRHWKIA